MRVGVWCVVGGLVLAAAVVAGCGDESVRYHRQACELADAIEVDGLQRHSVRSGQFVDRIDCSRAFFFGPPPDDLRAAVIAPRFELRAPTRALFTVDPGSTYVLSGTGPEACSMTVERYEQTAMLDPWLGLSDDQRQAIRAGTSVLFEFLVNCAPE
ncbi:hypothetical protein [Nocardia colli]|uniref:hypothetical protein n=1 Tax=Nocardia colli TaxID=2545717 RepID=UPI0035D8DA55